ncbi:hypothetical protein BDV28DRAFT_163345 [Aspergillus coremiiformis]|uniref:Uncharacterized protein n=1 Tax=Aspergillus coremiiformis TaxID=138285 RepID=A0A5N6ZCA4_9EURO|nr:hypothetical protein BDV28DRAFT_163345 [Aspergillus coremiiformis]
MTTPSDPPLTRQEKLHLQREADYKRFKTTAAYVFLVASPILIALPPRRMNMLTALLGGAFGASADHVVRERTGRGILDRVSGAARTDLSLPSERAREVRAKLWEAKERRLREEGMSEEEVLELRERQLADRGVLGSLWMGGETGGWRERRLREEREALESGKGYGDLIREHIWDVWTWGKGGDK